MTKTELWKRTGFSLKAGVALNVSGQEDSGTGLVWGLRRSASAGRSCSGQVRDGESFGRSPLGLPRLQEASGIQPIFFLWEFSCPVSTSLSFLKNHPQARWSCPFPGSWPWEGCQLPPTTTISVLIHGTQVGREKREKKDVKGDLEDSPLPLPEASKQQGPVCIREQLR